MTNTNLYHIILLRNLFLGGRFMHDIRLNTEEEIELFKIRFKLPVLFKILYVAMIVISFGLTVTGLILLFTASYTVHNYYYNYWYTNYVNLTLGSIFTPAGAVLLAIFILLFSFHGKIIKKNGCTITNKRIYGIKSKGFRLTSYSYRLDDVDDIQVSTYLRFNSATFRFSPGFVGLNPVYRTSPIVKTLKLSYVENYQDLYDNLSKLQAYMKNEKDVLIELELKRIEEEARKAAALERLAESKNK